VGPDELVGRRLEDILVSRAPVVGEELPGLGQPRYHDVVLLLDGGDRYWLLGDQLEPWTRADDLEPMDPVRFEIDPALHRRGATITGVSSADEGDLVLELDGRVTLLVTADYGTRIVLVSRG